MFEKKRGLLRLCILIAVECLIVLFIVWLVDPFYQYHAPLAGENAVLNDRDNQMPGSIRNFSYDSVLMGSSVVENCDSGYLDEWYECETLKIIRASGSVADLLYYLQMAQEEHTLKNVFWCLDIPALNSDVECTLYGSEMPRYLHTETILDDNTYIFNKDILFQTIPTMLAYGHIGKNVGGDAYNWADDKEFSVARAMAAYEKPAEITEPRDFSDEKELVEQNIAMIKSQVETHPEIVYRFFFPPYSMNWWDCAYVNGELEEKFYILEQTIPALLPYDNVEIYFFQDEQEIVCNLEKYMDLVHYSPDVNQYMLEKMHAGESRVTQENYRQVLSEMREFVRQITDEFIYEYYPRQ